MIITSKVTIRCDAPDCAVEAEMISKKLPKGWTGRRWVKGILSRPLGTPKPPPDLHWCPDHKAVGEADTRHQDYQDAMHNTRVPS